MPPIGPIGHKDLIRYLKQCSFGLTEAAST